MRAKVAPRLGCERHRLIEFESLRRIAVARTKMTEACRDGHTPAMRPRLVENPAGTDQTWLCAMVTGALLILCTTVLAECGSDARDGPTSDPGRVTCGGTSCPAGAGAGCCLPIPGDPLAPGDAGTCVDPQHVCGSSSLGSFECNEAADCTAGAVCCYQWGSGAFSVRSRCVTACPTASGGLGEQVQACRTNAECAVSGACKLRTCGGVTLATCAATSDCP